MQASEGNELELNRSRLANLFQGMQNDRYGQMTPLEVMLKQKDAAFAQDEMNNPQLRDWRMKGMIGKEQSAAAAGEFDQKAMNAKLTAQLAKYKAEVPKAQFEQESAEMEQLARGIEMAIPQLEQIPPGMMRNQAAIKLGAQLGLNPQVVGGLAANGTLDDLESLKKLGAAMRHSLENTTGQRQAMQKEELKSVTGLEQSRIAAEASKYGADSRVKDAKASSDARRLAFQKAPPQVKYTTAKMAIESNTSPFTGEPLDEQERQMLTAAAASAAEIMNAGNAARVAGNPNVGQMTGGKVPTYPVPQVGGGMGGPATTGLPPGVTIKQR